MSTFIRVWLAPLFLVLALVSFQLWKQTGDLWWTLGACGFALASIGETWLLLDTIRRK